MEVEVKLKEKGKKSNVKVNGKEVDYVREITFFQTVGSDPVFNLDLVPQKCEVVGNIEGVEKEQFQLTVYGVKLPVELSMKIREKMLK
jgi:hypothetical protein